MTDYIQEKALTFKICGPGQVEEQSSQLPGGSMNEHHQREHTHPQALQPKTAVSAVKPDANMTERHHLLTLKICSQRQWSQRSSQQPPGSWTEYHQGECTHPQDLWPRAGGCAVQPAACWTVFLQGAAVTAPATLVLSVHAETFATVGHQQGALVDAHWWTWEQMSLMFKFKLIIRI